MKTIAGKAQAKITQSMDVLFLTNSIEISLKLVFQSTTCLVYNKGYGNSSNRPGPSLISGTYNLEKL